MKNLHKNKKSSKFEKPDGVVWIKVCKETGLRASKKCSSTYSELFSEENIPDYCDESGNAVEICEDTGKLANEFCPNKETKYFSYVLPKERLKLWKTPMSISKAPTEVCSEHNEKTSAESAKAPKISLIGDATMTLTVGDVYTEKGATAKDDKDGDITSKIQISGSVNTSKAGTYTVKYTVKNSYGKETTKTRTIIVKEKESTAPVTPSTPTKPSTPTTSNTTSGGTANNDKTENKDKDKDNKTP